MLLVDTSTWINFFRNSSLPQVSYLEKAIIEKDNIAICGVILTEVLQGIKKESQYHKTEKYFETLIYLPMPKTTFKKSADIYRQLRKSGITIRKPVDCMIAAVAIENNIPLLHNDKDFEVIAGHLDLKIYNG